MKAQNLFNDIIESYIYMERYVNEGSPSGFTKVHTTSFETNPFTGKDRFCLLEFKDEDCEFTTLGKQVMLLDKHVNYAHPDSINSDILKKAGRVLKQSELIVSPTASSRTMMLRNQNQKGFLKLTYDVSRIGRCDRQISYLGSLASLEASQKFKEAIDTGKLPVTTAILLESSMRISNLRLGEKSFEWGTIFRDFEPYPRTSTKEVALVPAFSLFSRDYNMPQDDYLINQFISLSGHKPIDYLRETTKIIVDSFWNILLQCAFRPEMHAQNCMFEVDRNYNISRIVIKDMEDVDKDVRLAKILGYDDEWLSYPYKCYDENSPEFLYRASYMYDFKLGEYLLTPIIRTVSQRYDVDTQKVEKEIREYVRDKYLLCVPNDYFPDGYWYYCKNIERRNGEKRVFYSNNNPKFR